MRLIEFTPAACLHCGKGNTPDRNGDPIQFVDLERDVSWNEPVILCEDCVLMIGGMIGMPSPDLIMEKDRRIAKRDKKIHELETQLAKTDQRLKKLGLQLRDEVAA